MKSYLYVSIFILLSFSANASWQTYQNDLRNTGVSNGTGYFPLRAVNFSDDSFGMDFQPLIDDLDNNGSKEIVIFSNSSLIIFNHQLMISKQSKVGDILAQPALFNFDDDNLIEIIFNARQNSTDYFFAYQYNNSNLRQEFNITLSNQADFGGIKCVKLDAANACVFKDKKNYINMINMNSKAISSYNTSVYEEVRHTVPAIGDIDNDGNPEAVFWFNEDNRSGYGFLVFDLAERKLDTSFNNSGIVDNIFSPEILGPSLFHQLFMLKGQPVLADLNNDNKLEIAASIFYDDSFTGVARSDWFTELFVYSHNGTNLFSKCEPNVFSNVGCNDDQSTSERWEGLNPLAFDYDKNGIDDICFIKDVKSTSGGSGFQYMALSCYNYNGNKIAETKLENTGDSIRGTAIAADMNNDGYMDIITSNNINIANGSSILSPPLNKTPPIAVDIDGNGGLDLIWTVSSQTMVFLDSGKYAADLAVSGISFAGLNETHVNVLASIRNSGNAEADNVKTIVYNAATLENRTFVSKIVRGGNLTLKAALEPKKRQKILVSADFENEINETDESNNFAFKEFNGLPYVFVSADTGLFLIDSEVKNYMKNKLTSGYYTENENEADVSVYIGKFNPRNRVNNIRTLEEFEFGYDSGNVIFNDKIGTNPYAALVGAFKDDDNKIKIMIVGNEIEGDISGAKEFIKNQALLLNAKDKKAVFVDDENVDAVKVFDYLHLGGNSEHYNVNSQQFKTIVKNALNDKMFNVFDKSVVSSNGITLRLRNMKPNISNDYLEYLNSTGVPVEMPVVLAHGLFSNLTTWEVLGAELSNIGRDTWLIEITGGPSQDCDDCIDYTFYNLTDIFVPALLNGVLDVTGKDKIQYVGFSNGCRSALDSLERNQFDSNKIETFVAVGCPGAFEGESSGGNKLKENGGLAISKFASQNKKHLNFGDVSKEVIGLPLFSTANEKISLNLLGFYHNITSSKEDQQPGQNLNLNRFYLIQGAFTNNSDLIVTTVDENVIYENIIADKKQYFSLTSTHAGLDDRSRTKTLIRKFVNNETLSWFEKAIILKSSD
ncbi:hypothetical protein HYY71_05905 [Candidatus Woesearchaeota archaeon]|nr:hypothetical protein [Candidatus Woesearchaeota archaeon]